METDGRGLALRWGAALVVVLALHAGFVALLMDRVVAPPIMPPAPEAIMLDLAPDLPALQPAVATVPTLAAVPPPTPLAAPPPPVPLAPEPPPPPPSPEPPPPELPPTPPVPAEAVLPTPPPPPPRPEPKPKPRPTPRPVLRRVERAPPPQEEATPAPQQPQAATPVPTGPAQPRSRPPAPPSNAVPAWRSALLGRLQAAKRYPDLARSRGDQGVATVTFTMSRSGRILQVALVRSSGSSLLDEEAVALVHRAEPLPQIPDDLAGAAVTLTVPISFALR